MAKWLDDTGLSYFWGKIKNRLLPSGGSSGQVLAKSSATDYATEWVTPSSGGSSCSAKTFYGTSATAAATQAKVVTCSDFTASDLVAGTMISIKFTYAQSYNGAPTLNINGTGAKTVKEYGTTNLPRYWWYAGEVVGFTYDGTYWLVTNAMHATTTYYGHTKLVDSITSTSTATAATPNSVKMVYDTITRMNPRNLFIIKTSSPGYLNTSGAMVAQSASLERTSDFIPVSDASGQKYTVQVWNDSGDLTTYEPWVCIQFFNSSKTLVGQYVRAVQSTDHYTATIDMANFQSSAYMRVSSRWLTSYGFRTFSRVMVESGDTAHDYQLAPEDYEIPVYGPLNIGNGCYFSVYGRVCVLQFYGSVALTSSWTNVTFSAYIPSERFWPQQVQVRAPVVSQNTGGRCAELWVTTSGQIGVMGLGGSAITEQTLMGTAVWIC